MKICAISDLHGNLPTNIEKSDLLLIAGDIIPLYIQRDNIESYEWFEKEFIPWCYSLPVDKIIFIAGNHDFYLEQSYIAPNNRYNIKNLLKDHDPENKITYLINELTTYKGINIYGTPICHQFYNWAFMPDAKEQKKMFFEEAKKLKDTKVDIVLSHDAPYGVSDIILQPIYGGDKKHIGNPELTTFIQDIKPNYMLHGHLHSTNHECEMLWNTKVYNVSLLDERYNLVYKPFYFEL